MRKFLNLIFILALGGISTFILSGVSDYTRPIIEKYEELSLKKTILEAADLESGDADDLKAVLDALEKNNIKENTIERKGEDDFEYYIRLSDKRHIFKFTGRGLWGPIKGVIALKPDLETIEKLRIISQEETPGLGGRITEEQFLEKFRNQKVDLELVLRREPKGDHEIDAISGATMTSQAFINMINESVRDFRKVMRGGNNAL